MAKIAVAKRDSIGTEIHGAHGFNKGDTFPVIEEANDFMVFILMEKLREEGELDEATIVDFGDGFVVFFEEENDKAWGIHDYFEIKEVGAHA